MTQEEKEYFIANLLPTQTVRQLIRYNKMLAFDIEKYEFEATMIRKYFQCSFYQKARAMTADQLSERLFDLVNERLPYTQKEAEEAERKIFLNHQAREKLVSENMPYAGMSFLEIRLQQQELF